jgi:integrase
MKSAQNLTAPHIKIPKPADNESVNPKDTFELRSIIEEIRRKEGIDFLCINNGYHQLLESGLGTDPQHTVDHVNCLACKAVDEIMKADLLGMSGQTFPEAARVWQSVRRNSNSLRERTHESVDDYISALSRFFKRTTMSSITPGMLKSYQMARKTNAIIMNDKVQRPWKRAAGHSRINHEINLLEQMLKACKEWEKIKPYYSRLKEENWSPRQILTEKQEEELFKKVAGYPEAELAYCVAAITNNTTASGMELRGLKFENIFLRKPEEISEIYIPPEACKNDSRLRKIALNKVARWAVEKVCKRAIKLGSTKQEHYVFPFRKKRCLYIPEQQATRWFLRCSWNHLREISGFPNLRPHDLRHHAITRMLENGVDGDLVNAISGHVSQRMREYYSHQRTKVRYDAARAIEPEYDIRKLMTDGRRRVSQERVKTKARPKLESMA